MFGKAGSYKTIIFSKTKLLAIQIRMKRLTRKGRRKHEDEGGFFNDYIYFGNRRERRKETF